MKLKAIPVLDKNWSHHTSGRWRTLLSTFGGIISGNLFKVVENMTNFLVNLIEFQFILPTIKSQKKEVKKSSHAVSFRFSWIKNPTDGFYLHTAWFLHFQCKPAMNQRLKLLLTLLSSELSVKEMDGKPQM